MSRRPRRSARPPSPAMARSLHAGLTEMRGATAPRLLLELRLRADAAARRHRREPGLLERLERLERRSAIAAAPPAPGEAGGGPSGHGSSGPPEPGRRPGATSVPRVTPQAGDGPQAGDAPQVGDVPRAGAPRRSMTPRGLARPRGPMTPRRLATPRGLARPRGPVTPRRLVTPRREATPRKPRALRSASGWRRSVSRRPRAPGWRSQGCSRTCRAPRRWASGVSRRRRRRPTRLAGDPGGGQAAQEAHGGAAGQRHCAGRGARHTGPVHRHRPAGPAAVGAEQHRRHRRGPARRARGPVAGAVRARRWRCAPRP